MIPVLSVPVQEFNFVIEQRGVARWNVTLTCSTLVVMLIVG